MRKSAAILLFFILSTVSAYGTDQLPIEPKSMTIKGMSGGIGWGYIPATDSFMAYEYPEPYDSYTFCVSQSTAVDPTGANCGYTVESDASTVAIRGKDLCYNGAGTYYVRSRANISSTNESNDYSVDYRTVYCVDDVQVFDSTYRVSSSTSTLSETTSSTSSSTTTAFPGDTTTVPVTTSSTTSQPPIELPPSQVPDSQYISWDAVTTNCSGCYYEYTLTPAVVFAVTPTAVVPGGTFSSDISWYRKGAGWTIASNVANKASNASLGYLTVPMTATANHVYQIEFKLSGVDGLNEAVAISAGGITTTNYYRLTGTYNLRIQAPSPIVSPNLVFIPRQPTNTFTIDNVSVIDETTWAGSDSGTYPSPNSTDQIFCQSVQDLCSYLSASTDSTFWVRAVNSSGYKSKWVALHPLTCEASAITTSSTSSSSSSTSSSVSATTSVSTTTTAYPCSENFNVTNTTDVDGSTDFSSETDANSKLSISSNKMLFNADTESQVGYVSNTATGGECTVNSPTVTVKFKITFDDIANVAPTSPNKAFYVLYLNQGTIGSGGQTVAAFKFNTSSATVYSQGCEYRTSAGMQYPNAGVLTGLAADTEYNCTAYYSADPVVGGCYFNCTGNALTPTAVSILNKNTDGYDVDNLDFGGRKNGLGSGTTDTNVLFDDYYYYNYDAR